MLRSIQLPFKTLWICDICGNSEDEIKRMDRCSEKLELQFLEKPTVQLMQEVEIFVPQLKGVVEKQPFSVTDIFYSEPGDSIGLGWATVRNPSTHALCLELTQSYDRGEAKAWKPSDSMSSTTWIIYSDFLLWQEGDRGKLEKANLIKPLESPTPKKKSFWDKLLELFKPVV